MKSLIVIPSLNPDEELINYIHTLVSNNVTKILVINDGSDSTYDEIFTKIREIPECTVLIHEVNQGKGKALKDALKYYNSQELYKKYNGVITVDADGQHTIKDVLRIAELMEEYGSALILGERAFDKDVPFRSRFGNSCTRVLFKALYGISVYDTQTGLRGIPNSLVETFSELKGDRYEYEMNMLMTCSLKKIPINSITIETIYLDGNSSSHFNAIKDSAKIYGLLFGTFLKFTFSSLSSSILDLAIFQLFIFLFKGAKIGEYILFSTIGARVISSVYNLMLNKQVVFKSDGKLGNTILKYYSLCICQMLLSALLVQALYSITHIYETVIKVVVDTILFFISFRIQQNWVFKKKL